MFSDIDIDSAQRITEVREYIDFIDKQIPPLPTKTPRYVEAAKGMVFVQLYAVVEFTVNRTIAKAATLIDAQNLNLQDLKPFLWAMALDSQLEALVNVGKKKWNKRYELNQNIYDNGVANMRNDLMPTDGGNFTHKQLQSIWNTFCIIEPLFDDVSFQFRLKDIVVNRINIAHGNSSAADVGSRTTITELRNRLNETSSFCTYFISVFEVYMSDRGYLA